MGLSITWYDESFFLCGLMVKFWRAKTSFLTRAGIQNVSLNTDSYRFSAFWLRSKCSICSYQLNIWYGDHVSPSEMKNYGFTKSFEHWEAWEAWCNFWQASSYFWQGHGYFWQGQGYFWQAQSTFGYFWPASSYFWQPQSYFLRAQSKFWLAQSYSKLFVYHSIFVSIGNSTFRNSYFVFLNL